MGGAIAVGRIVGVVIRVQDRTALEVVACPMTQVPVAGPDGALSEFLPPLTFRTGGRALVFDNVALVGIVSPLDVSRAVERSAFSGSTTGMPAPGPAPGTSSCPTADLAGARSVSS
jgi:hypothetical protein